MEGKLKKIEDLSKKPSQDQESARRLKQLKQEYLNIKAVETMARQCPTCRYDIVKIEG